MTPDHVSSLSARVFWSRAGKELWRCLPQLLLYDLLFKVLAFVLLSPLLSALFGFFISRSGSHAIGNTDIARFLLSPVGLATLAIIIPLAFTLSFLEVAGLLMIGMGAAQGRPVGWYEALRLSLSKSSRIIGLSFLWLLLALISLLPFLAAAALVYYLLLSGHDINYYLHLKPPEYRTAVKIGIVIAAAAALVLTVIFVTLAFALPIVLFREESLRSSLRGSLSLVKRHARTVTISLAGFLVGWGAISAATNLALNLAGKALITAAGERTAVLIPLLGGMVALDTLVGVILAFSGMAFGCLLVMALYRSLMGEDTVTVDRFRRRAEGPAGHAAGRTWRLSRKACVALAGAALAAAVGASIGLLENLSLEDRVDITAHRGSSLKAPENTLSAIEQAIADGADFAEFDVQETADGVIVVAHDADLMRVAGSPAVITGTTLSDLRDVDVGSHFGPQFAGERIPTLEEVIDTARGRIRLNVELKTYAGDYRSLAGKVVGTLEEQKMLGDAVVMSLEYREVQEVRRLDPNVTVGFTPSVAIGDVTRLDCDFLAVSASMAQGPLIAAAHAEGKGVHVWTVNEPVDISLMIDRGVDNIITDDPATAVRVLEERADLSNVERLLLRFRHLYVD